MNLPRRAELNQQADDGWWSRERALALALIAATAVAFFLCFLLVRPFLPALAWALALVVVARPAHDWIASRVRNADLAAALAVVLVAVVLLGPTAFVLQQLTREVAENVERVQADTQSGRWQQAIEANPHLAPAFRWLEKHVDLNGAVEQAVRQLAGDVPSFVTGSVGAAVQLLVTLFVLFYFFRDRREGLRALRSLVPLSDAETDEVVTRVNDTVHATVYGTLFVAAVQGVLGGLMFWWLGLPAPVLWGVVMGLLAVVPWLGAFVVWVPAALFLALEGNWGKALILTAWGTVIVGLIDNLLYPVLVGNRLRLHTLPVFFAILGGLALFGAAGVILGPVILAITWALVDVWRRRTAGGQKADAVGVVEKSPALETSTN